MDLKNVVLKAKVLCHDEESEQSEDND